MSRQLIWRAPPLLCGARGAAALVSTKPARFGLDLRGGTQFVLDGQETPERGLSDDTMVRTVEVLRRRVDQLGMSEPSLQRSGDERIIVELPGVTDPEEVLEVIDRTAQLTFYLVEASLSAGPNRRTTTLDADGGCVTSRAGCGKTARRLGKEEKEKR